MTDKHLYAFPHGTVREMESCLNQIGYKVDISNYQVATNLSKSHNEERMYYTCRKPNKGFGVFFKVPHEAILITAKTTILGEL